MGILSAIGEAFKADFNKQMQKGQTKTLKVEYIGGLPGQRGKVLQLQDYKGELKLGGKVATQVSLQWKEQHDRSAGKAAAGAIIGGVLTGGVGLLAGAAIGGKKTDKSQAVILAMIEDQPVQVYVRCDQAEFRELVDFLL